MSRLRVKTGRQLRSLHRVLEKRVLLDASIAMDASASLTADDGDTSTPGSDPSTEQDANKSVLQQARDKFIESGDGGIGYRLELVVIDLQLNGAQALVDDLIQRASDISHSEKSMQLVVDGRSITLLTLDASDSLLTVTDLLLQSAEKFDAVHLISHGGAGGIDVGGEEISLTSLTDDSSFSHGAQLQSWTNSLTANADILLYGCNTGYSLTGKQFIQQVSSLTGADVAASEDATGSALRGGDWALEQQHGDVDTDIVFSQLLQGTWGGLLAAEPTASADVPSEAFINETTDLTFTFQNQGDTEGFGPFMDIVFGPGVEVQDVTGFLGATFEEFTVVNGEWVDSNNNPVEFHPYDTNQTGAINLPPVGPESSTWYAVQLPFGSVTPDQPAYTFTATVLLNESAGAVVGTPIPVWVRPGFIFGEDALNNPDTDPPIVSNPIQTSITPSVMVVSKQPQDGDGDNASIGEDRETVTGPSEPVTWRVVVDIANQSTIENLVITEQVPNNFYYIQDNVTVTDSAGNPLILDTDYTLSQPDEGVNNNAELVVTLLTPITGTTANDEIVITYTGYVPDTDANGNPIVVSDGAEDAVRNNVTVTGEYQDQSISSSDSATITASATALQKDVALIEDNFAAGFSPGDRLEYTLTLQVSDYMQLGNLVLTDFLNDGLQVVPGSVNFELFYNGTTTGPSAVASGNITIMENIDPGDGSTELSVDLSQELIDRGITNGTLDGDLFADDTPQGTTTITVTYEVIIRELYIGAPNAGEAINALDALSNRAVINASATSANDAAVDNDSSESILIANAEFSKSVFAVNGNTDPDALNDIGVGDEVTFSLQVDLGTLDNEGAIVTDYLPLPVFIATDSTFDDTPGAAGNPGLNQWNFGPATEFDNWPEGYLESIPVEVTVDAQSNAITWTFAEVEQTASEGGIVQLLFTVQVQDQPFTDGLFLTNVGRLTILSTNGETVLPADGVPLEVLAPELSITKGVVSTDNPLGELEPTAAGPVAFDEAGTTPSGIPWTGGAITSQNLDLTPIDSNLGNIDAGDIVRFALVVENSGGADAFDLVISDTLPDGFEIPTGALNLQIYTGDGTSVTFTGNAEDLFTGGITLEDFSPSEGVLNQGRSTETGDITDGSNIVIITYDLVASTSVRPNQLVENTAFIEGYGGVDDGTDFTEGNTNINWQDEALVAFSENTLEKTLDETSITSDNNTNTQAVIGETVTYSLTLTIAEGTTPSANIIDTLDSGLQFIGVTSVSFSDGISSTLDLNTIAGNPDGQQVIFDLGDITNANTDNAVAETITITYQALVENVAGNQNGDQLNNSAQLLWDSTVGDGDNPTAQATASSENLTVIEPDLQVDKSLINTPQPIDAGDLVTYEVVISHSGFSDTDSFDLTFEDQLPAELEDYTLISVIHSSEGDITDQFTISPTGLVQTIDGADVDLLLGETITIQVSGNVIGTIGASTTVANTATVDWTSIDGDNDNERTGEDGENGALDDYESRGSETFVSAPVQGISKVIIDSSVFSSSNGVAEGVIGETVTYSVTFGIPEGVQVTAQIVDTLPAGLEFVSLDSVTLGADILLDLNDDGVFGDDPANVVAVVGDNGEVSFDFGDVQNTAGGGTDSDLVTLVYTVRIENVSSNQAGATLTNSAQFFVNDGEEDAVETTVTVLEPLLLIEKSANVATADNGDPLEYTITITNPGDGSSTTAHDISFNDPLPAELTNPSLTATLDTGLGPSDISGLFAIIDGEIVLDPQAELDLEPGSVVTVTVSGILANTLAGSTITNTADIDWSSLNGDDPNERTGAEGESGDLNNYASSNTVSVTVNAPTIEKNLVSTSQNDDLNDITEATIGELVTFSVTITLPESALTGQGFDVYGPGFEYVDLLSVSTNNPDAIEVDFDQIIVVNDPGNNTVTVDFGTLFNTDTDNTTTETVTFVYRLRVTDIPSNVDGITLENNATLDYDTDGDGTPDTQISDSAAVDLVEPLLIVDKALVSASPLTLGSLATYEISIRLDPSSGADAYNVVVQDELPTFLTAVEDANIVIVGGDPAVVNNSTANLLILNVSEIDSSTVITVTFDVRVTSDPSAVGEEVTNNVEVDYTSLDTPEDGDDSAIEREYETEDTVTTFIAAWDLFINKDDGGVDENNPALPGDMVAYTLNYGNRGSAIATDVMITETLPEYATFDAANSSAGWVNNGDSTYSIEIGDLDPDATGSVTFAVTLVDPLPVGVEQTSNSASIDSPDGVDPVPEDNTDNEDTPIDGRPDYVIDKIENFEDPANPGDAVEWTIEVSNEGDQHGTGVVVTDNLPDTSLFNSFVASDGGVIDLTAGTVTWTIGDMAVGDSYTFTLSAVVNESVPATIPTQTNSVTVEDDGTNGADPTPDNNTDSEDLQIAYVDLAIDKDDGGITLEPGDTLVYTLNYTNNGTAAASGVVITESLPEYATFDAASSDSRWVQNGNTLTLALGDVAAGESGSVDFAVIIDAPIPAGIEETSNTTSIEDDGNTGPDQNLENNDDDEVTPIDGRPDYVIDKIEEFDDPAFPGETISWSIVVTNEGNQDGTGVVVTDTLPTGNFYDAGFSASDGGVVDLDAGTVTWDIGDLAAGDSVTLTLTTTVNEDVPPILLPEQFNSVEVTDDGGNGADPTPENNTDVEAFFITEVDLSISKDDGGITAVPGGSITYTLNYANIGTAPAELVLITETIPENTTFDAANSDSRWVQRANGTIVILIGLLDEGEQGSAAYTVIVDEPLPAGVEEVFNETEITYAEGRGPDQNTRNNTDDDTTPVIAQPDYVIDKIENFEDPTNPGDTIEWTITIANQGNQDGTGVVITDYLPNASLYSSFDASDGGAIDLTEETVTWDIGDLAVGDSVTVTLSAVVVDDLPENYPPQTNSAEVTDDGDNGPDPTPDNNRDDESFNITFVDLSINKAVNDADGIVEPGEVVTYTLSYNNLGTSIATGVTITESLPPNTTFDASNSTPGWSLIGDEYVIEIGSVAPGESGSVQFAIIVDSPLPAGVDSFGNVARIEDDGAFGPDQLLRNNTTAERDTPTIAIEAAPDYVIDKSENFEGPLHPGDPVNWTIVVTNEGTQDGTGVVVTDTLPDTSLLTNFAASNGGIIDLNAGTVTWKIGDLAVGEVVTLTVSAVVADSVPADVAPQNNNVSVDDDGNNGADPTPDNNTDDEPFEIQFVDLYIDKDDGGAVPEPTDTLVYTLTYGNRGTATASGVVITETLPPNTSFNSGTSTPGWVQNGDSFTFDVGTLAPGEEGSVTFAVTVDYPIDATIQQTDNTATINDDGKNGPDQNPDDNIDTDETEIKNDILVDNITLSQLYPEIIYAPREWEQHAPELHGRLISRETESVSANLQGARNGGNFDPALGPVDGRYYPNDWSRVFSNDLSIDTSDTGGEKSSPLQLDKDTGRYRANSLFGDFVRPAASPELPAGAPDWAPSAEPLPSPLQSSPLADEPLNLQPERSQLQQQLDDITREIKESRVSPLLVALSELSIEEDHQQQAK